MKFVLDTNVVLDWLWFADRRAQWLSRCLDRCVLLSHELSLDELVRVVNYESLHIDPPRRTAIVSQYKALTTTASAPADFSRQNLQLPTGFARCRDSDDDLFLALAFHGGAHAIVTKDKALLKLAKRLRAFNIRVVDLDAARLLAEGTVV